MAPFLLLQNLPSELLQHIVELLDKPDLCRLNLASRWAYEVATPLVWNDLELTDCNNDTHSHEDEVVDEHDDTPMLRKLLVLVR